MFFFFIYNYFCVQGALRGGLHHGGAPRDRAAVHLRRVQQHRPSQGRLPEQARSRSRPRIVSITKSIGGKKLKIEKGELIFIGAFPNG